MLKDQNAVESTEGERLALHILLCQLREAKTNNLILEGAYGAEVAHHAGTLIEMVRGHYETVLTKRIAALGGPPAPCELFVKRVEHLMVAQAKAA